MTAVSPEWADWGLIAQQSLGEDPPTFVAAMEHLNCAANTSADIAAEQKAVTEATLTLQARQVELGEDPDTVSLEQALLYASLVRVVGNTHIGPFFTIVPTEKSRQTYQTGGEIALTDYVLAEPLVNPGTKVDTDPNIYRRVGGQTLTIDQDGKISFPNINIRNRLVPQKSVATN